MHINEETRTLINILRFRVEALLEAELAANPITSETYRSVSERNAEDAVFVSALGQELGGIISSSEDFGVALAPRLCPVIAGLFWSQATNRLIDQSNCDFKNFGKLGANRSGGLVQVSFQESTVLGNNAVPETLLSTLRAESLAEDLTRQVFLPVREQLLRRPDFGYPAAWQIPLVVTALLTRGLPALWRLAPPSLPGGVVQDQGLISSIALLTSFATYLSWTVGLGTHMSLWPNLAVEGLGTLLRSDSGTVGFQANTDFRNLLSINIPRAEGRAA